MEVPLPQVDAGPGPHWNPWEIALIHAVDTARTGPLRSTGRETHRTANGAVKPIADEIRTMLPFEPPKA